MNGLLILVVQAKQRPWLVDPEGDSSDMMFVWWKLKVLIGTPAYFKLSIQIAREIFKWPSHPSTGNQTQTPVHSFLLKVFPSWWCWVLWVCLLIILTWEESPRQQWNQSQWKTNSKSHRDPTKSNSLWYLWGEQTRGERIWEPEWKRISGTYEEAGRWLESPHAFFTWLVYCLWVVLGLVGLRDSVSWHFF